MSLRKTILLLLIFSFGIFLLVPNSVLAADMPNTLSNEACKTCHQNYPGVKTGLQSYDVKHKFTNCSTCHNNYIAEWMWNCRYCHLTEYQGKSGFKSYSGPLSGYPLGTGEFMDEHGYRTFVDSNWIKHSTNMSNKHSSNFSDTGCISCHQSNITLEHEGKIKVYTDPSEGFENSGTIFNFSGTWLKTTRNPRSGSYCYQNQAIANNSSSSTQFTVSIETQGTLTFWYRVSTESGYDKLYFYIDGVEKFGGKSGNIGWTKVSYSLTPGTHTLKWTYTKDASVKANEDSVYIDDITISGVSLTTKFDCNTCHLSTNSTVKNAITLYKDTSCTACHAQSDHGSDHTTTLDASCLECHSPGLEKEHSSRMNDLGNPYDCGTCHNSTNQRVTDAIKNNNKNCSACHDETNHESLHSTQLDENCQTCHSSTISQDHVKNPLFLGLSYKCSTCHTSSKNEVIRAINSNNLNCGACHSSGHGLPLADKVPIDISLYSGVKWTLPKSTNFFISEAGAPSGYESGQVVLSNRSSSINASQVWDYYSQQMQVNGWKLVSTAPKSTDTYLSIQFQKNNRQVTVKCFNTANRTGTGEPLTAGHKIEIWYK